MKKYKKKRHTRTRAAARKGRYAQNTYGRHTTDAAEGADERPSSQSYEQKPPKKKKKRKKKHYLLKFFILLAICVGLYYFLHSSVFNIKQILVPEGGRFTVEQVKEMTGLKTGTNLFEFKAGDCEEKLMENSYIKDAEIKRKLPGTVEIKLTERKEQAVLMQEKQYVVIDLEGIVLRKALKDPRQPVLEGITVTKAAENKPVAVKEKYAFRKALQLLTAMEKADLYFKKVDVSSLIIKLYVTDKLYCKGEAKNLLTGMEEGNLKAVLYDLYKKKIKKGVVNVGDDQYYSFSKKIK